MTKPGFSPNMNAYENLGEIMKQMVEKRLEIIQDDVKVALSDEVI